MTWTARILPLLVSAALVGTAIAQTTVKYVHTDALGNVRAISDEQGNIIERYDYEPYGALIGRDNPDAPGYTGHVMDSATGLTYMQQRYMDPALGIFVSADPVTAHGGDVRHFNRYTYAYNNPYRYTDPDGRAPWAICGAPIGAVVNIGVQMSGANGSFGERLSQVSLSQVGIAAAAGALSGGVSAIAGTASTTGGAIAANLMGNAGIGAAATQASSIAGGRIATVGEVMAGAVAAGGLSALGSTAAAAPGMAKSASAGMSQTERTATANLLGGIKEGTPGFKYTNDVQGAANAVGAGIGAASGLTPLIEDNKR